MTEDQIRDIIRQRAVPHPSSELTLIETHISWVILTDRYAYKIKKPVTFSFLDFSTLALRRQFCYIEVELNRRLAPGIYLGVLPVREVRGGVRIGNHYGVPIDYAVFMKRLDTARQMHLLLEHHAVTSQHIADLADQLARFHRSAEIIYDTHTAEEIAGIFSDILNSRDQLERVMGREAYGLIQRVDADVNAFLEHSRGRFAERIQSGFVRDCHGDLHSGNIFLLENPVIFDCIEFNPRLRHIDVLNEIAFLAMDLEYYEQPMLSAHLIRCYNALFQSIRDRQDDAIYKFYKLYRANVKIKVAVLKSLQAENEEEREESTGQIRRYFALFRMLYDEFSHAV